MILEENIERKDNNFLLRLGVYYVVSVLIWNVFDCFFLIFICSGDSELGDVVISVLNFWCYDWSLEFCFVIVLFF